MMYQDQKYWGDEYRVTDYGLQVCNSSDPLVQERWRGFIAWGKEMMAYNHCYDSVDGFYDENYTLFQNLTVFFKPTGQTFTRQEYGVIFGYFAICSAKLSLSCNDDLVIVKNNEQYHVFNNFSLFYNNKIYDYREYRFNHDSLEMCASKDSRVQAIWRTRNSWEKFKEVYKCRVCNYYYFLHYAVSKQFIVYLSPTGQYFTRNDYGVIDGKPHICEEKLRAELTEYTQEDLLMCNDSIINIKYDDEYKVWNNFSILYKNKVYDYTEYRVLNDSIKICNSTDNHVRNIWKYRNRWVKNRMHLKSCTKPITYTEYNPATYTVLKDFSVLIQKTNQVVPKYDYGMFEGKLMICDEKLSFYVTNIKIIIVPLCALALSFTCLLLLLIIYCILPELRTLPGLNLMSLSFAFLLWQTYLVAFLSLYSRVGKLAKTPCDRLFITTKFITYSILMNAAVNIYYLRKTFCGNTLVKADVNKWKRFFTYSFFSWGIPVILTIVYIILVKQDVLRFDQHVSIQEDSLRQLNGEYVEIGKGMAKEDDIRVYQHITGNCIMTLVGDCHITPSWLAAIDVYGFQGCLVLYVLVMFFFTAYRVRQKLKESSSIAQKSNIAKNHKFVMLLKLSTTTALSYWLPLFISQIVDLSFDIKIALYTVTLFTGAYIGIAFAFTRRNYTLLKKKYSPAKHKSFSTIAPA